LTVADSVTQTANERAGQAFDVVVSIGIVFELGKASGEPAPLIDLCPELFGCFSG
jgi:hypothetical protein